MPDKKLLSSKHFCILPWVHARINQDGNVYPCCRIEDFFSFGSLKKNDFETIWNDEAIRNFRSQLKKDLPSKSCNDCYKIESRGGISLRQQSNSDFADHIYKVNATQEDGRVDSSNLSFLDIRFSNICNFKCRSCNHENSTTWYQDTHSFSNKNVPSHVVRPVENPEHLWALLNQQIASLKKIYMAGGEPLLHEEHYQLLELLIRQNKSDIELEYNTNLSSLEYKHWKIVEIWKHFPNITLGASLDGVAEQGELIRKGMNWLNTVRNFRIIQESAPHVKFILAPTISVLNCFHITAAIETFIEIGMLKNPDFFRPNVLFQPNYLSIQILNSKERQNLEKHYLDFLDRIYKSTAHPLFSKIESELKSILTHMHSLPSDENERKRFKKFTIKLDILRNEKTLRLFPELIELILAE